MTMIGDRDISPLVMAPSNLLMAILACWYEANSIVASPFDLPEKSYCRMESAALDIRRTSSINQVRVTHGVKGRRKRQHEH